MKLHIKKPVQLVFILLSVSLLSACELFNTRPVLSESVGKVEALSIDSGRVITDNQRSFDAKLALIDQATKSIDLVYFIFADDYSSSVLASHLIMASKRGIKVRLLVDYVTNYSRLDWFSMLEQEGGGNLTVRFYGRPTNNMVKDAAYMTMGCSDAVSVNDRSACSNEKLNQIKMLFSAERLKGKKAESLNISNLNVANSGLFLSGLYAKNTHAMTLAIEQGQQISLDDVISSGESASSHQVDGLKTFGQIYWKSRTGPAYQRVYNRLKTALAFRQYGDALNPVYASFSTFLPIERKNIDDAARDWDFFTDYTHHKLLLVDNQTFIMGGRNIEDSYHMHPNELSAKYTFMDTDVVTKLSEASQEMQHRFNELWSFVGTASLDEVRQHAPNEFVANWHWATRYCSKRLEPEACRDERLNTVHLALAQRLELEKNKLKRHRQVYLNDYHSSLQFAKRFPDFLLASQSRGTYLENLPYRATHRNQTRQFGATYNQDDVSNKNIHQYWINKLGEQCATGDKLPRDIYIYNAYFFPPPNVILAFKALIDGREDCSHVTLHIITNSVATTDLVPVNILASHSMKAFLDYYVKHFDKQRSATVQYYEYQKQEDGAPLSLHSKVTVFEDALVVGSANMDVRSYFMDTNNALVIQEDTHLIEQYQRYLVERIHDSNLIQLNNAALQATTLESLIETDRQLLQASLEKYRVKNRLSEQQYQTMVLKMEELTRAAYQLTRNLLATDSESKQKVISERFYQLFKTI